MKEVTKLVLHHDLEDLVKYQTSEIKSMFEMYSHKQLRMDVKKNLTVPYL